MQYFCLDAEEFVNQILSKYRNVKYIYLIRSGISAKLCIIVVENSTISSIAFISKVIKKIVV